MKSNFEITQLFKEITHIRDRFSKNSKDNPDQFNIFRILRMTRNENKTHTRFIAELLNPHGSHNMGKIFIKKFLEILNVSDFPIDDVKVQTEKFIGNTTETSGGRIDLLIESNGRLIIMENKIDATDQPNQLLRYHNYNFRAEILYLTLFGDLPAPCSLGGEKFTYRCISYKEHILPWLEQCIDAVQNPIVCECIAQYRTVVCNITGSNMKKEEAMCITDEIMKNDDYILSVLNLLEDHSVLYSKLQDRLKKHLDNITSSEKVNIEYLKLLANYF